MAKEDKLKYGPPGKHAEHFCVDMQRMFLEATEWQITYLPKVLPNMVAIVNAHPEDTIFTRFIPQEKPGQGQGMWREYYKRWDTMTVSKLGFDMLDIAPELARFVPPARVFDKHVYSPWTGTDLHEQLRLRGVDTIIITGGETEMCVLSTALGAIDWGFRVILVTDAICSSADETHDAMMNIYTQRFGQQLETVSTGVLLENWE
jgi:nicotinamidase-related amidase